MASITTDKAISQLPYESKQVSNFNKAQFKPNSHNALETNKNLAAA